MSVPCRDGPAITQGLPTEVRNEHAIVARGISRRRGARLVVLRRHMLGIAGIMRLFDSLWAFRYDGPVPDELEGALLGTSLTTYGWDWLIVGLVLLGSSFAVLTVPSSLVGWGSSAVRCWQSQRSGGCPSTRCGHSRTSSSVCSWCTASLPTADAPGPLTLASIGRRGRSTRRP